MILPNPPLMFITDPAAPRPLPEIVEDACAAGLRWVCLRDTQASGMELLETAYALRNVTAKHSAQLFISRNLGVARQVDADGLHLASHQDVAQMRKLIGDKIIIGQSTHSLAAAQTAVENGANYVTLSPVFNPASKNDERAPLGIKLFKQITAQLPVPVIALGGMNCDTIPAVKNAGAAGAAFIGAVAATDNVANAIQHLINAWRA